MHVFPDAPFVDTSLLEPPKATFFVRAFYSRGCRQSGTPICTRVSWNPLRSRVELCLHSVTAAEKHGFVNIVDAAQPNIARVSATLTDRDVAL
jgi:hypothetical protein